MSRSTPARKPRPEHHHTPAHHGSEVRHIPEARARARALLREGEGPSDRPAPGENAERELDRSRRGQGLVLDRRGRRGHGPVPRPPEVLADFFVHGRHADWFGRHDDGRGLRPADEKAPDDRVQLGADVLWR